MWCDNCGQDVPGVAVPDDPDCICCARCRRSMSGPRVPSDDGPPGRFSQAERPLAGRHRFSSATAWELEDDLFAASRWAGIAPETRREPRREAWFPGGGKVAAKDSPAAPAARASDVATAKTGPLPDEQPTGIPARSGILRRVVMGFSWAGMTAGASLLALGVVLWAWSLIAMRGELWSVGVSAAVTGQFLLLIGLLVQFDELNRSQRRQYDLLCRLGQEVQRLRGSRVPARRASRSEIDRVSDLDRDLVDIGL